MSEANYNLDELGQQDFGDLNGKIGFALLYNKSEEAVNQIVEVMIQNGVETFSDYYYWLNDISTAPQWFKDAVAALNIAIREEQLQWDEDLNTLDALLRYSEVYNGQKQILVPHSQGDFYANAVLNSLEHDSIGIVGVAPPTSRIAGDYPHITMENDWVIDLVRHAYPDTLEPTDYYFTFGDLAGHKFVETYLKSGVVDDKIVEVAESLDCPYPRY